MRNIISFFPKKELEEAASLFTDFRNITYSGVGNSSSKSMLLSDILRRDNSKNGNVLWVVNGKDNQLSTKKAAELWGDRDVFLYNQKGPEDRLTYSSNKEFEEAKDFDLVEFSLRVFLNKNAIFVIDFHSLLQNFPNVSLMKKEMIVVEDGEDLDPVKFVENIVGIGYEVSEDENISKGEYYRIGDSFLIWPINSEKSCRIEIGFDKVEKILVDGKSEKVLNIFPLEYEKDTFSIVDLFEGNGIIIDDEIDVVDEYYTVWNEIMDEASSKCGTISFTSFNDDSKNHKHLHFMSVLKYRTSYDLANDFRDKLSADWRVFFFTKNFSEAKALLDDQKVPFVTGIEKDRFSRGTIFLIDVEKEDVFPQSFQVPDAKLFLLTDKDVAMVRDVKKKVTNRNVFDDFLTGLKMGDYVVHADHGIAKFLGLDQKTVDEVTKEYLKLGYAENDKLFVPIDQADKVNKYIGSAELMPKLTRLGSAEWNTLTSRVKKETQAIAKELLKLYAERRAAKGFKFKPDSDSQEKFEETFPYDETPGQLKAINDTKQDMETDASMDRLVCGDVGFGKTEVAMRAAFKAVQNGKQVALVSPITILADQHYKSFKKRMDEFHVRIEMLSRFRSAKQQREIIQKLEKGEVDIIIGTHRLLQPDIKFKDLGLVVIDEEQRFGVKQKEKLKGMRKEVDILTLTATPIPRTLNICLNKLRDITTITTPPFGRLPVITEVRKYSASLLREAILREVERKGQAYVLHNRVQTIDSFADKLRALVPEARFCVAHGKLGSGDLEERILSFTEHKYDVLVSSTIIENGIDLSNANTLIVNHAEKFGLAQLYQLRGRVGRGKKQAFAYFLYHGQRLKLDAKKRLRAIVEASDLGSGFQIAMKDLEIRGAGDILGANQHGVINVVGVGHFMRMLNKSVEDLKAGRVFDGDEEIDDVSVELPVAGYIPDEYISVAKDKINAYQRLSSADTLDYLKEVKQDMVEDYGKMPTELSNLFKIIELKILAKNAGILNVKAGPIPMSKDKEIVLHMSKRVKPANIMSLLEYNPKWVISGERLKINMRDLGNLWFNELGKCVGKLGKMAKHGAKKA